MSHDRGCFQCGDDPPYTDCKRKDCPKREEPVAKKEVKFNIGVLVGRTIAQVEVSPDGKSLDLVLNRLPTGLHPSRVQIAIDGNGRLQAQSIMYANLEMK